jgi:uncharacterized protein YdeI (YjbR/CyaY-like superfamily)
MNLATQPTFFTSQSDFRKWLEENHDKASELIVGFYKVGSGKPGMTWSESVDQAICFGWIDGIRKSIDKDSYFIRFTPRNPKSIWSAVNIRKVETLTAQGLMQAAGIAVHNLRKESKSGIYSYENKEIRLPDDFEKEFRLNEKAWAYFQSMPFSYRKPAIYWVMSARQETTRLKRLAELICDSEAARKIKPLSY